MVVLTFVLIGWSILIAAPIEQPANPANTPNPSKAPWYFLGLQEMLVYFDPWLAGVVFPSLIIVGLMAIPYFDMNPKGERVLHLQGAQLGDRDLPVRFSHPVGAPGHTRYVPPGGPIGISSGHTNTGTSTNWKPLVNVNLSEYVWVRLLGVGLPSNILLREMFGFIAVLAYLLAIPPLLARTWFKGFYQTLGPARYHIMVFLLLAMASLPIKMVLRWTLNMKYIVGIPEYFFNI